MTKFARAAGLSLLASCATLPAAPLDPADPLGPALARAEAALRALAADVAAGAAGPRVEPALAGVEQARVALAARQVTAGARLEDVAIGAVLLACREGALRLAALPQPMAAREAVRGFALACLAPLSVVTAGFTAPAGPQDQRL
ncbi:MAG: hypothetical protein ACK4Z0_04595 [Sphingomonadaceae bacterium]